MRTFAAVVTTMLAAGMLLGAGARPCVADVAMYASAPIASDVTAAPQPGTEEEERSYALREAESPAAEDFTGGIIGLLILVALVVIIVLLVRDGAP